MNNSISFKKRLALNIFKKYRKTEASLHELQYLFWECTLRCNLKCIHCGSDCKQDFTEPEMPFKDFIKVTSEIRKQYNPNNIMIVFTGGEPLIRKDLELCGEELLKQGYNWGMVTNGVLLSEKRLLSLIDSGLSSVTISLDGFEENHNWMRNSICFNDVIKAIKMLVKQKRIIFDVVTCVNKKNIHELSELKKYLISIEVKKWRLFTISPIGRAKNNPELLISNSQLKMLLDFIKNSRQENEIQVSYECEGFVGKYEMEVRNNYFFCRAGINIASILSDGSISACPNIDRQFSQGNIYKNNFLEIWNNQFEIMRNRKWMKNDICLKCNVFKWCEGNGFHLRDYDSKKVLMCQYKMLNE